MDGASAPNAMRDPLGRFVSIQARAPRKLALSFNALANGIAPINTSATANPAPSARANRGVTRAACANSQPTIATMLAWTKR